MSLARTQALGGALARSLPAACALCLSAAALLASPRALAGPGDTQAGKGLLFARRGDCVKAIPYLEEAELARHRPNTAVALAGCYVATGELIRASELYHVVIADKPARYWVRADYNAQKAAKQKAADLDKRIPTLRFRTEIDYQELEIEVGGHALADVDAEKQIAPDVAVEVVARAKGRKPFRDKLVLTERERRVVTLRLEPLAPPEPPKRPIPTTWIGARYRGLIIPRFLFNTFADGGTNLLVPGGALTVTTAASDTDVVVSLGYFSYRMGETPFKAKGTPDTEWEHVSSDLHALTLSIDLLWSFPLNASKTWLFRVGGGAGVGWTFLGDIRRNQVYPKSGKPGDPANYTKCKGPNDPRGTFRYCNALDKDANHYGDYVEPDWFHGGVRPRIYPWLVLPEIGLTWRVAHAVAVDLEVGASLSGILTGLGLRFGL